MDRLLFALTLFAALGSGVMTGLYFTFSTFAMTALGRIAPPAGIAAMQSINRVILNPWFFVVFFGTAAASLVLALAALLRWSMPGAAWLLAGSLLYLIGNIGVTLAFNVPRNEALDRVEPESEEGARVWADYLVTWTQWNHVRTVACLAATAAFILALR